MNEMPRGETAVMARRVTPPNSLEFFPTPPWATRALFEHVLPHIGIDVSEIETVCDPMCGQGHISNVAKEYVGEVIAADIFDYGIGAIQSDYLDEMFSEVLPVANWTVTNPPFAPALDVVLRAIEMSDDGVAVLLRTQWLEGADRYDKLFRDNPPTLFAPFVERVPMIEGRWDPEASSATAYAWFCWAADVDKDGKKIKAQPMPPFWIPPGCSTTLTRPGDRERFAPWSVVPVSDEEIEVIARALCKMDGVDPEETNSFQVRDTLTYRERKATSFRGMSRCPNWRGRRREADDVFAMRLMGNAA